MDTNELVASAFAWLGFLIFLYWYSNKHRHADRKPLHAFFLFFGVVFAVIIAVSVLGTYIEYEYGKPSEGAIKGLAITLVVFVVIPSWNYAKSLIKAAPKKSS